MARDEWVCRKIEIEQNEPEFGMLAKLERLPELSDTQPVFKAQD
jgi:hypothetical protein